jgi:hypothetical protein
MKESPILMSAPMVRAILDGRKNQTRRTVTTREPLQFLGGLGEESDPDKWGWFFDGPDHHGYMVLGRGHDERHDHGLTSIRCPYGEPGDRLWVRETWRSSLSDERTIHYAASLSEYDRKKKGPWRPSIFMPRAFSRITLEIIEVRVQRLQSISEDDARAEGVEAVDPTTIGASLAVCSRSKRIWFSALWDAINGKRASWASSPWVWAISFRRIER